MQPAKSGVLGKAQEQSKIELRAAGGLSNSGGTILEHRKIFYIYQLLNKALGN
jgi:hypothetical protein